MTKTETVISIHRKTDLRHARLLAEHIRLQRGMPVSAVTDEVIEKFADMLEEARAWRREEIDRANAELARANTEIEADIAALRVEVGRVKALNDALTAFVSARKVLDEALNECHRA